MRKPLPEIYAYILRNICLKGNIIVSSDFVIKSIKKVVYKAPIFVFREIIKEFTEDFCVFKRIGKTSFRIYLNNKVRKQLRQLNNHIFPIRV